MSALWGARIQFAQRGQPDRGLQPGGSTDRCAKSEKRGMQSSGRRLRTAGNDPTGRRRRPKDVITPDYPAAQMLCCPRS